MVNNEDNVIKLEKAMKLASNMLLDDKSETDIANALREEYPEVDSNQVLVDVKEIHALLEDQKASKKKIERVMDKPLASYKKARHIMLMKAFILEIKDQAYQGKKSDEIKESLEKDSNYIFFMHSKNKEFVSLRKSIPKLVKVVREMKAKGKTENEILNFLYKHLFSYIKF